MTGKRLSRHLVLAVGSFLAAGAFALIAPSPSAADDRRPQSLSRATASEASSSRASSSPSTRGSSDRTVVNRSGGDRSRGAGVTRSGGGRRVDSHRGGRRHHGRGYYGYGWPYYRYGFGYHGLFYGGYGGFYYSPYYYGHPGYSYHGSRRYGDLGGVDVNVRPKKTELWVDGQYVGTVGKFDGYPGVLWLRDGEHELIFYKPGFESVRRVVKVLEGVVLDIHHTMVLGESIAAEELTMFSQEELERRMKTREDRRSSRTSDRSEAREEPGRLKLDIAPMDASIYLDGRFLGSGQELARLRSGLVVAPGEHTLEVVRPGFASEEVPFSIEPGEETALEVELEEA